MQGHKEYLRNYMEPNPRTYVSSKGYSFTKKTGKANLSLYLIKHNMIRLLRDP